MTIKTLRLYNFKNTADQIISFDSGVNIIYGKNAAGKTNILESVFLFAAGKSFKGIKERDFIKFGEEKASAEISFEDKAGGKTLEMRVFKNEKRQIYKNGARVVKLSEFLGQFRAVIFTPDHLNLVKGSPEGRRRFVDMAICQSFPRYVASLSEYSRILSQKNALLKSGNIENELLEVYNERMAALAAQITQNRHKYLQRLSCEAKNFLQDMTEGSESLSLRYESQAGEEFENTEEVRKRYMALYTGKSEQERLRGITLYGPHKDDFSVYINKKDARTFASQGQQRSAVLSLKLAEGELSQKLTGEYPVFLLDDILSELDGGRKKYILERTGGKQVIITGCEKEFFDGIESKSKIYLERGKPCFYT